MAKGGNKIGDTFVDVHANTDPLKQDLKGAEKVVTDSTAKMEGGFTKVGTKIEGATAGVRKFSGAISSSVGAVTALVGSFAALVGIIAIIKKGTEAIQNHFVKMSELSPGLAGALERQAALLDKQRADTPVEASFREKIAELEEKRLVLSRLQVTTTRVGVTVTQEQVDKAQEQLLIWDRQLSKLKEQLDFLRQQNDTGAEGIKLYDSLSDRADKFYVHLAELRRDRLKDEQEDAEATRQLWLDAYNQIVADQDAAATKLADSIAKALGEAVSGSQFEQDIAGPIEQLGRRLELKIDALKFRGGR